MRIKGNKYIYFFERHDVATSWYENLFGRVKRRWRGIFSTSLGGTHDFMEYKKFNKLLNINIRNSKRNSYRNFCTSLKKETGPLQWKKLIWLTRSNTVSFPTFKIDDTKITNDKEKSEILIEQYKKVSEVNSSKFNRQHKIKVERRIHREQRNEFFKQRNQKETREIYEYYQEFKIHASIIPILKAGKDPTNP